jgi:hypothetical protein
MTWIATGNIHLFVKCNLRVLTEAILEEEKDEESTFSGARLGEKGSARGEGVHVTLRGGSRWISTQTVDWDHVNSRTFGEIIGTRPTLGWNGTERIDYLCHFANLLAGMCGSVLLSVQHSCVQLGVWALCWLCACDFVIIITSHCPSRAW